MELIVALGKNGVIGNDNKLPWNIPEDLIRFKHMTIGNVLIMGRKTFESFPNGPLKNRIHVVLTKSPMYSNNPDVIFTTADKLRELIEPYSKTRKIFVIGGAEIYDLLFSYCDVFHITLVDSISEGDAKFPYTMDYFMHNYFTFYSSEWFISKTGTSYKYYTFFKL